jgi:hypothetical protein
MASEPLATGFWRDFISQKRPRLVDSLCSALPRLPESLRGTMNIARLAKARWRISAVQSMVGQPVDTFGDAFRLANGTENLSPARSNHLPVFGVMRMVTRSSTPLLTGRGLRRAKEARAHHIGA